MNSTPAAAHLNAAAPIVLRGPSALSPFRVQKLLDVMRTAGLNVSSVTAEFVHFVSTARPLDAEQTPILERLLVYGEGQNTSFEPAVIVIPRSGTVSPWSSKATNIAQNCGLESVSRIERGTAYAIDGFSSLSAAEQSLVYACLHDPMTEEVRAPGVHAERADHDAADDQHGFRLLAFKRPRAGG